MTDQSTKITLTFTPESMRELERMASDQGSTIPVVIANALALYKLSKNKTVLLRSFKGNEMFEIRVNK
ncbi:MAG: hypothetical protein O3B87_04790 [bacterium]|nr:hypothetical protein [bacterium]